MLPRGSPALLLVLLLQLQHSLVCLMLLLPQERSRGPSGPHILQRNIYKTFPTLLLLQQAMQVIVRRYLLLLLLLLHAPPPPHGTCYAKY